MKLIDCLKLNVSTKELAKLAGVSERQIRKFRTDPKRRVPDVNVSDAQINILIADSEYKSRKDKLRDLWYSADIMALLVLKEQEKIWKQVNLIPNFNPSSQEAVKLLEQIDKKIQDALTKLDEIRIQAQQAGIEAIWNPQEKEKKRILKFFDKVNEMLKTPSDKMKDRIEKRLEVSHVR